MFKPVSRYKKIKKRVLRKISKKVDGELIRNSLPRIDINKGDHIFVHSSLSKFGNVIGGGRVVIDSLIDAVGSEGTVLFPGFNIKGSVSNTLSHFAKSGTIFDIETTVPSTGILCRIFKEKYDPEISIHPTHSVLAKGKLAKTFTKDHHKASSTFGVDSPFVKLMEANGKIVGMGSDFGHVTFFHVLEDMSNSFPIEVYEEKEYEIACALKTGEIIINKFKAHKSQKCRIEKTCGIYIRRLFWKKLQRLGNLKTCKIGSATCWSINSRDLYTFLECEMQKGRTIYSEAPNLFLKQIYKVIGLIHEINR